MAAHSTDDVLQNRAPAHDDSLSLAAAATVNDSPHAHWMEKVFVNVRAGIMYVRVVEKDGRDEE